MSDRGESKDNESEEGRRNDKRDGVSPWPLRVHRAFVVALYIGAASASYTVLTRTNAGGNFTSLLSSTAIFATLGSAISALGSIWGRELAERVALNIDIFMRDIAEQETPWRRWPFLPRSGNRRLFSGHTLTTELANPVISFDVGTHIEKVNLPTVVSDFFDLPMLRNCYVTQRFRKSLHTAMTRKNEDQVGEETGMKPMNEYMAFECIGDIWLSILKFRVARYAIHFGSALTISAIVVFGWMLVVTGVLV